MQENQVSVNASSRIQAAVPPATLPVSSSSDTQGPGEGVFRETMRQAMEPGKEPAKAPARVSSHPSSLAHTASPSLQASKPAAPQASQGKPTNTGAGAAQSSDSTPNTSAAGGSGGPVSDPSTNGNTQSLATSPVAVEAGSVKSLDSILTNGSSSTDPVAAGSSNDSVVKGSHGSDKNSKKNVNPAGADAKPAAISTAVPIMAPIAILPTAPVAELSVGMNMSKGSPATKVSVASSDNAHGMVQGGTVSSNSAGTAVNTDTKTTANMTTTVSSSDLLLNSMDGVDSPAQVSANSTDSQDAAAFGGATLNDIASGLAAGITGNIQSKMPDPSGSPQKGTSSVDTAAAARVASHAGTAVHTEPIGTQPPTALSDGQPGVPAMGNISSGHTVVSAAGSSGPSNTGSTQQPMTPSATFAAMDRADPSAAGFLLHAAPNQVAVGVADPGLGWIEVRAERVAGQVTAALTANSITSHAELTSVLPAMSSYLNDHHQAVQQIHVETGLTGQNSAGSQENSGGHQYRGNETPEPLAAISGISTGSRVASVQTMQRANHTAEVAHQRSTVEGHQFSVRA